MVEVALNTNWTGTKPPLAESVENRKRQTLVWDNFAVAKLHK